jgi:ribosomal protein S18 acetylase RimI-like enzyme
MSAARETKVRIRPLRAADVESIIAIDALVTGEEKAGFWRGMLTLYEAPPADARRAEGAAEGVEGDLPSPSPSGTVYLCEVAESEGRVVGFVLGDVQSWQFGIPRCGRIIAIGVHPDFRRGGVASLLARETLESFRKMGLPLVQCLVRPGDPLEDFFSSLGFTPSRWITMEKRIG